MTRDTNEPILALEAGLVGKLVGGHSVQWHRAREEPISVYERGGVIERSG